MKKKRIKPKNSRSRKEKEAGAKRSLLSKSRTALEMRQSPAKFSKLQKEWYEKLKRSGFDDLEWTDHKSGEGHNSSFLRNSRTGVNARLDLNKELYYTMCRNWLTHAGPKKKIDRIMFEMHAEGKGYRDIVAKVRGWLPKRSSHTSVFMRMKPLIAEMLRWNEADERGVIKSREAQDFEIELYANTLWQREN